MVPARPHRTAGFAAALVAGVTGVTGITAVTAPALQQPSIVASPAVELAAALQDLFQPSALSAGPETLSPSPIAHVGGVEASAGDWIINAYWTIQPWVEYGVELFGWGTGWLPWPIGLLAPQSDIIYNAWQPFAESVVYSLAFLVDGQFDLILPTLSAGIQTGINNLIQGEIAWILSFFPPLPPIGGAAAKLVSRTADPAAAAASTDSSAEADAEQPANSGRAAAEPQRSAISALEPPPAAQDPEINSQAARQSVRGSARASRSNPAVAAAAATQPAVAATQTGAVSTAAAPELTSPVRDSSDSGDSAGNAKGTAKVGRSAR